MIDRVGREGQNMAQNEPLLASEIQETSKQTRPSVVVAVMIIR